MKTATFILGNMQTNCYFIIDEASSETAVIDPAAESDKIITKLKERNIVLKYILITHAHFDHIMALEALRDVFPEAKVCIHAHDSEALANPEQNYMKQFGGIIKPCRPADILLEDGSILPLGSEKLKIMHTPGHTMGSVCIFAGGSIFTGDTLFKGDIGRYDLYGGDYAQIMRSLKKLAALEQDYKIFPGHGSSTRLNVEKESNLYLK